MEHLSTDEVMRLAQLAIAELAARTGQPQQPAAPQDPLRAILAAAGQPQAPRPPGTPLMPPRPAQPPPERNFSLTRTPLAPGAYANAHTDPEAAAIFAGRPARHDGSTAVAGNGVGSGAVSLEP